MPNLITSPQAGVILGKSSRTVHRLIDSGRLTPAHKLPGPNGAFLFDSDEVQALAETLKAESDPETEQVPA